VSGPPSEVRCNDALRSALASNLAAFSAREIGDVTLRRAAVALAVTGAPTQGLAPSLLLTLRPARLKQHSGQYALPGGKLDGDETPEQAALRELDEELGLSLEPCDVLGRLDDYPTRSGFRIAPIVVWAGEACTLVPSPDEVAEVFHIPFSELDSDAIPHFDDGEHDDAPVLLSRFPTLGHAMYSPTASIMYQFREVAIRGCSTRVAHFDQPRFAWA